jgi:predicted DNA-binding protein with PD1-like motif
MYDVQATVGPVHILKPAYGSDLLKELNDFVHNQGINLAWFSGLGAVSRATIRYYDQPKQEWVDFDHDERLEVAGMLGNVTLLNGEPIVHAHITLADAQGRCFGGHVVDHLAVERSGPGDIAPVSPTRASCPPT